jgi:topoisomerase-4 subunit B
MIDDLFSNKALKGSKKEEYSAKDIEVLEGLEPVRRRPGMYIGGTDENAMHHLIVEVFDNAMDEVVAGHASRIEIELKADNTVTISDNGRGIPVDPHPKFPKKSALEIILTTLHSGGKFSGKVYATSGGLHGVGISVVNALSDKLEVEVVKEKQLFTQTYSRGAALGKLSKEGQVNNRRGTTITFHPDPDIFGTKAHFKPQKVYSFVRSKAYLFRGVEIRWSCDPALLGGKETVPQQDTIHFPNGLQDFLKEELHNLRTVTSEPFIGEAPLAEKMGRAEWAVHWAMEEDGFVHSYCNTIPTSLGGTHEYGLRNALTRGIREYGEMVGNKKAAQITADDVFANAFTLLSIFYKDPQFQGQTKEKLVSSGTSRLVENAIRDHFDHWLSRSPDEANRLLEFLILKAEERARKKADKAVSRKSIVQKLRLPGKLADCTSENPETTEIFLVEGDSAGGSAKQARSRETQAILPLRGKILNVASATVDKIKANQEINDVVLALGCGSGDLYDESRLRYGKVIIMTDADVDGAHIASLLMTYFFREMPKLIENGHLFLAQPPLYRLTQGGQAHYARSDEEKDRLVKELSKNRQNVEIGRFKGLGEMTAPQLKETTMDPSVRSLQKVMIEDAAQEHTASQVERLMGKKPELRLQFIQEKTEKLKDHISEHLDI